MTDTTLHIPVLLHESIDGLNLKPGDVVLDATFGGGGHSAAIAEKIGPTGTLVMMDVDPEAFSRIATSGLSKFPCRKLPLLGNFRNARKILSDHGLLQVNAVLFDLGVSSYHFETSGRGFSFRKDEPLLMTMGLASGQTASTLVNEASQAELATIFREYGEEEHADLIAEAIVIRRELGPIATSMELADLISDTVPGWYRNRRIHPATKTFQALRIAVNDEFGAIRDGLAGAWTMLAVGGRMAVITFHSLEDRIVKQIVKEWAAQGSGNLITKHVIPPSREETLKNPRSRSAKLRIIEKK